MAVEVDVVYTRNYGLPARSVTVPSSERLNLGRYAAEVPPLPYSVIETMTARRSGRPASEAVVVYESKDEAEDARLWTQTVLKAEYPQEYGYTLILAENSLSR